MPRRYKRAYRGRRATLQKVITQNRLQLNAHRGIRNYAGTYGQFKLRGVLDIASNNAGTPGPAFNYGLRLTQPDSFDGAGTALTDWSSLVSLYDEFRVAGISIKFIPARPSDPASSTSYRPVYTFTDFDSVGLNLTIENIVAYDNMKVFDMSKPWKRYMKIPKLINTAGTTVARPGWMDTASPTTTGSLYLRADGLTANTVYGKLIVTYYIKTHNRK